MNGKQILSHYENQSVALAKVTRCESFYFGVRNLADSAQPDKKIVILGAVHGNEIGGIAIQSHLMKLIAENPKAFERLEITFLIGHPDAVAQNIRFIDKDLNRSFGSKGFDTTEGRRAKELEALILNADELIDLHQTVQPSVTPFFITAFHLPSLVMIERFNSELPIVSYKGEFSSEGLTAGQFAQHHGISAVTIETGSLGYHEDQIAATVPLMLRALGDQGGKISPKIYERIYTWDQTFTREQAGELLPGLSNFSTISAGQAIAQKDGHFLRSQRECLSLFPKYGELAKSSAEILRTIRRIQSDEWMDWIA